MDDYKTNKVIVMTCSLDLAKSLVLYRDELIKRSPIVMPHSWPSNLFKGFLPFYIEELETDKKEYRFWLVADLKLKKMIGDFILQKVNQSTGYLAISYINQEAEIEYMEESLYIFMKYTVKAFPEQIKTIVVDCPESKTYQMSVLKELGFLMEEEDSRYVRWVFNYT
ncbi:hypothetical protein [Peribacillus kribbensis]|uniref:hypothetical protein n=1 Tax=Peribacillus kribbensis TaxID=356658 RepID=UPI000421D4EF|nr:hypothetical protein [Peribacillus kribbensis]